MYCEICRNQTLNKEEELVTLSARAYTQVASILKLCHNAICESKVKENNQSVSVCVKCLQGL